MAIIGTVAINVSASGDFLGYVPTQIGLINPAAAFLEQFFTYNAGANTVTVPAQGATPVAVIIVPPAGNTQSIIFKGVSGDTGVRLHNTNPTMISLDSSVTSFVLTVGGTVTSLKFLWL
jgi:hypothetical protein